MSSPLSAVAYSVDDDHDDDYDLKKGGYSRKAPVYSHSTGHKFCGCCCSIRTASILMNLIVLVVFGCMLLVVPVKHVTIQMANQTMVEMNQTLTDEDVLNFVQGMKDAFNQTMTEMNKQGTAGTFGNDEEVFKLDSINDLEYNITGDDELSTRIGNLVVLFNQTLYSDNSTIDVDAVKGGMMDAMSIVIEVADGIDFTGYILRCTLTVLAHLSGIVGALRYSTFLIGGCVGYQSVMALLSLASGDLGMMGVLVSLFWLYPNLVLLYEVKAGITGKNVYSYKPVNQ